MQLRVKDYSYPVVYVFANPEYELKDDSPEAIYNISVRSSFDWEKAFLHTDLVIETAENQNDQPYKVMIQVAGAFELNVSKGKIEASPPLIERHIGLLLQNSMVMLYSSTREYLHTLTSKAPHGKHTLPSAFFDHQDAYSGASKPRDREPLDLVGLFIEHGLATNIDEDTADRASL